MNFLNKNPKDEIRVITSVFGRFPTKGCSIRDGAYEYIKTAEGLPAIKFRWEWSVIAVRHDIFVFRKNAEGVKQLTEDATKQAARTFAWNTAHDKFAVAGLLMRVVAGSMAAKGSASEDLKGIGVAYKNEKGCLGSFFALGRPVTIDEIIASIPPEKIL